MNYITMHQSLIGFPGSFSSLLSNPYIDFTALLTHLARIWSAKIRYVAESGAGGAVRPAGKTAYTNSDRDPSCLAG